MTGQRIMVSEVEALWSLVGKLAAGVGLVVALITGLERLATYLPGAKMKKRIEGMEEHLQADFEHLKKHDQAIDALRQKTDGTERQLEELNNGIHRIGRSQIALLRHTIDGNGIDKMKEEADDLTQFFIDR